MIVVLNISHLPPRHHCFPTSQDQSAQGGDSRTAHGLMFLGMRTTGCKCFPFAVVSFRMASQDLTNLKPLTTLVHRIKRTFSTTSMKQSSSAFSERHHPERVRHCQAVSCRSCRIRFSRPSSHPSQPSTHRFIGMEDSVHKGG